MIDEITALAAAETAAVAEVLRDLHAIMREPPPSLADQEHARAVKAERHCDDLAVSAGMLGGRVRTLLVQAGTVGDAVETLRQEIKDGKPNVAALRALADRMTQTLDTMRRQAEADLARYSPKREG